MGGCQNVKEFRIVFVCVCVLKKSVKILMGFLFCFCFTFLCVSVCVERGLTLKTSICRAMVGSRRGT